MPSFDRLGVYRAATLALVLAASVAEIVLLTRRADRWAVPNVYSFALCTATAAFSSAGLLLLRTSARASTEVVLAALFALDWGVDAVVFGTWWAPQANSSIALKFAMFALEILYAVVVVLVAARRPDGLRVRVHELAQGHVRLDDADTDNVA